MNLHRETSGAGPALVLLHGWGLNLRVFDALRDELAPQFEVITIDLPGHGRSPWDASRADFAAQVNWLLESLPPRCSLLGWSLGGQFAMELARIAPERLERLLLVATTPRFTAAADWASGMSAAAFADFEAQLQRDWRNTVADFLQLQVRGSRDALLSLQRLEDALQEQGQADPAALAAGLSVLKGLDQRPALTAIAKPTLVIAGQHDRITPPAAGAYIAAHVRDATLTVLPRAGHAPFLSHTAEFAAVLRDFLQMPA